MTQSCRNLIFILGDQLSHRISSLDGADAEKDVILMCEVADLKPESVIVTEPGEYRVLAAMREWQQALSLPVDIRQDRRFIATGDDFRAWAQGRRELTMEFFYRDMRRKTGLLMEGDKPVGGRWNFDAENRKPARPDLFRPAHKRFSPDAVTRAVMRLVDARFAGHMGEAKGFCLAVTRKDAEQAADTFIETFLPGFGDTQDAMLSDDPFLNHSLLSFYINLGLLDPLDICRRA